MKNIKTFNLTKDDYPEFEGKVIKYEMSSGRVEPVIVVGCNRSVGCTLINPNDKDDYHVCVIGPAAPGFRKEYWGDNYDKMFNALVQGIDEGLVIVQDVFVAHDPMVQSLFHTAPDGTMCAFGQ